MLWLAGRTFNGISNLKEMIKHTVRSSLVIFLIFDNYCLQKSSLGFIIDYSFCKIMFKYFNRKARLLVLEVASEVC